VRWRFESTLACLCLALGCKSAEPELEAYLGEAFAETDAKIDAETDAKLVAPVDPPVGAWVLISEHRTWLTAPDLGASHVRFTPTGTDAKRVAVVRSVIDGFVELATITAKPAETCAPTFGFEHHYELRFFVERDAAVLVEPEAFEARDCDPDPAARSAEATPQHDGFSPIYGGAFRREQLTNEIGCWTVAVDTPVLWTDGSRAGVVIAAHELPRTAKERGDKVCFDAGGIASCIETAKLERKDFDCESDLDDPRDGRPQVRQARPTVGAGLDLDIVRWLVLAQIEALRSCYADGLAKHPTLRGRVAIAFSINAAGKVASATVHDTTLEPRTTQVPTCFAKAVRRWRFPKPEGGKTVRVVYPFMLSPASR
jgi:hypothetical protein